MTAVKVKKERKIIFTFFTFFKFQRELIDGILHFNSSTLSTSTWIEWHTQYTTYLLKYQCVRACVEVALLGKLSTWHTHAIVPLSTYSPLFVSVLAFVSVSLSCTRFLYKTLCGAMNYIPFNRTFHSYPPHVKYYYIFQFNFASRAQKSVRTEYQRKGRTNEWMNGGTATAAAVAAVSNYA